MSINIFEGLSKENEAWLRDAAKRLIGFGNPIPIVKGDFAGLLKLMKNGVLSNSKEGEIILRALTLRWDGVSDLRMIFIGVAVDEIVKLKNLTSPEREALLKNTRCFFENKELRELSGYDSGRDKAEHHRAFKSPVVEGTERNPGHRANGVTRTIHPGV